ncbi:mersacidin/lichenicidin family type 2 lantibiotic [Rhizomonospora bruguierae]|uniref:mersacidin/lichenicidin family type 2 lantibiotic n=1 Tax=Rhizomonospora bruguierae TaxID=1581705 RepID=UPI001BCC680F|nr:mersacidin/lichenicidin family type 2 lantibiotic [Micromonospora sp. NBRC 107566]
MNHVRAWKDLDYRDSISGEELATLPAHPAGGILADAELAQISGGTPTTPVCGVITIVTLSAAYCTKNSVCGTCGLWTSGCC